MGSTLLDGPTPAYSARVDLMVWRSHSCRYVFRPITTWNDSTRALVHFRMCAHISFCLYQLPLLHVHTHEVGAGGAEWYGGGSRTSAKQGEGEGMGGCSASAFFTARACARAQLHAPRLCEQIVDLFVVLSVVKKLSHPLDHPLPATVCSGCRHPHSRPKRYTTRHSHVIATSTTALSASLVPTPLNISSFQRIFTSLLQVQPPTRGKERQQSKDSLRRRWGGGLPCLHNSSPA